MQRPDGSFVLFSKTTPDGIGMMYVKRRIEIGERLVDTYFIEFDGMGAANSYPMCLIESMHPEKVLAAYIMIHSRVDARAYMLKSMFGHEPGRDIDPTSN